MYIITSVSFRALQTDDGVLSDQDATALVGTRAQFTVERGPLQSVAVVSLRAPVAVLARGVVLTNAPTCQQRTNARIRRSRKKVGLHSSEDSRVSLRSG